MTGVIIVFVTPVIISDYPGDYKDTLFSSNLKSMIDNLIPPRWRKVLRDLVQNKSRTIIIILSLVIGVFTVSLLIDSESLIRTAFDRQYATINPSSATLIIPEGFDNDFILSIRRMPEIQEADGLRSVNLRVNAGTDRRVNLQISAFPDFNDIRINKVMSYSGVWPPAKGEILLEKSSLLLASMPVLNPGDRLSVQTNNDQNTTLKFSGIAYDFNRTPSPGTGIAYGYVSLSTLERFGESDKMNALRIVVAQNKSDKLYIRQVVDLIKQKVKNGGKTVGSVEIPNPGEHPLGTVLNGLDVILGSLGILTLFGGAFLVFNIISALLSQQKRQIGMMKAIGARTDQIVVIFLGMVFILGLLALVISAPLATLISIQAAKLIAGLFNLDLSTTNIPTTAILVEILIGLAVPFLAALYPIWLGARGTVREALADYDINTTGERSNLVTRFYEYLSSFSLPRPLLFSLRNTIRKQLRFMLTLLPLALSGAILITVINVRDSLQNEFQSILSYKNYSLDVSFENLYLPVEIENVARKVPGVIRVEGYRQTIDAFRIYDDSSQGKNFFVRGLTPSTDMFHLPVISGRWLTADDRDAVVVNDAFLRDEPDIQLNDKVRFKINGSKATLQVVGIVEEKMNMATAYLNETDYASLAGSHGRVNNLWVVTDPNESLDGVASALDAQLEKAGLYVASLTTVTEQRDFLDFHFSIMIIPLGFAAVLLALAGGLGLMGTMSTNVLERQREIGVMRSIGASDGDIQHVIISEGMFIGLASWLISVIAALPMTYLLDNLVGNKFLYIALPFSFPYFSMLFWLMVVIVTSLLSSYLPAQNASKSNVRELLAYE